MMRSNKMVLALITVSICFFAAHSFDSLELASTLISDGFEGKSNGRPWPCCNNCGICTKSIPPQCTCNDLVRSCHPECKNCVQMPYRIFPPLYQCKDLIVNYCEHKCHSK